MKRVVLAPLDGSALAERALPYAVAYARLRGCVLRLAQAVFVRPLPGLDATSEQLELTTGAERYLQAVADRLAAEGVACETLAPYGPAASALSDEARRPDVEALVLATHGRGGLQRQLLGSVATALLQRATVPVLLVRAWHASSTLARFTSGARILVPLDGSPLAEAALAPAEALAAALPGELVLVRAVTGDDISLSPGGMPAALHHDTSLAESTAQLYLERIAGRLAAAEYAVRPVVRAGAPAAAIAAAGREWGVALIVMTTHGRTGFDRLLFGSVAEAVVRDGSAPVLLVPLPAARHLTACPELPHRAPASDPPERAEPATTLYIFHKGETSAPPAPRLAGQEEKA